MICSSPLRRPEFKKQEEQTMNSIKEITPVDHWANAQPSESMPIYEIDGALYCAYNWNGEEWTRSFRVLNRYDLDEEHPREYGLRPIYRYEVEDREFDEDDEAAYDIVGFNID
nr:MAG TPA: hypothetical protein [Caudoviricetes sp.]